jgi:tRNA G18 (ribose-2'-O)-methylase SpoU
MSDSVMRRRLSTADLVATKPERDLFNSLPRFPIHVVCDDIRSLDNVGQIFRLSDAARVAKLHLCGITGYPPLPADDTRPPHVADRAGRVIGKTALSTVNSVPWSHSVTAGKVVRELKAQGVQIVVLEQTVCSDSYRVVPYRFPVCLVLGHERVGVGDEVLDEADLVVDIPMYGMGNSLNVAMAYGIVLYELVERWSPVQCPGRT